MAGTGFLLSHPLILSALRRQGRDVNGGKGGSIGKELDVPLEPAPVQELPCRSHSDAWAAAAPAAELCPGSGEVCSVLPALCSQAMDTLVNAPSLLSVGLLFS